VAALFWGPLSGILHMLASPFVIFFLWYYLGGEVTGLGNALRRQQNYRRMLDAAAVNPHDGEAQHQLGLILQHRRQYSEAIERFKKAIAIDPGLTDAHFQLGRIAREQGRRRDALGDFQTVIDQDERHSANEILRELGAIYVAARQFADARNELATYVERRPYDPEGLYYYGQTMEGLGEIGEARELYARAVEADRTAPRYRRRFGAMELAGAKLSPKAPPVAAERPMGPVTRHYGPCYFFTGAAGVTGAAVEGEAALLAAVFFTFLGCFLVVFAVVVAGFASVLFAAGAAGCWAANTVPTASAMVNKVVFILFLLAGVFAARSQSHLAGESQEQIAAAISHPHQLARSELIFLAFDAPGAGSSILPPPGPPHPPSPSSCTCPFRSSL
jgi:tetratricopeptide (TPR) repeat protein